MYRPYYYDRIAAGLDEHGMPIAWTHRIAGSSIMDRVINQLFPKTLRVMRAAGLHQLVAMVKGLRRAFHGIDVQPLDHRDRSEEHTSELQSQSNLVCRLLLEKKKIRE